MVRRPTPQCEWVCWVAVGRGTEDATNLVDTGGARVVALADMFQDQLDAARAHFDKIQGAKSYAALDASQLFVGPNAYERIMASKEVDAVVIATPPYYHPRHVEAAVAAGKHVYLEKPVAVDVPGALKVVEIGKRAEGKLSLDVGFQIRDCPPFVELVRRIHGGALGNIVCGEAHYLTGYIDRPSVAERFARRAAAAQLGLRPRAVRRHHRGTKHSRDRHLQLDPEGAPVEGFGDRRTAGTSRGRQLLRKLQCDFSLP